MEAVSESRYFAGQNVCTVRIVVLFEYFSEQIRKIKLTLGKQNKDGIRPKETIDLEEKLLSWMENTPVYLQLQWFDTEEVKISSELRNKRWNTEVTARDTLYLEKLGMSTH